VFKGLANIQQL